MYIPDINFGVLHQTNMEKNQSFSSKTVQLVFTNFTTKSWTFAAFQNGSLLSCSTCVYLIFTYARHLAHVLVPHICHIQIPQES